MSDVLKEWNNLPVDEAITALLPCNGSLAWARAVTLRRPLVLHEQIFQIFAAADEVWRGLAVEDWQQAFSSHPRLGEDFAVAATPRSLAWSQGEQGGLAGEEADRAALAAANREYESRFGRVFLLCATGRSMTEVMAALQRRLENDPQAELLEAAEQQRRITQLRLRKWLGVPAAGCDGV